ncbi:hypothetical protein [Variovorax sp.]|uniref:hypothetical protein n=1 Tax=Variovorax sp. TaxID=1871043 RepID=UPI002D68FE4F|nr:hypothetical protein [Variovorax sp.]HYP84557.1 hypothetical protein [Variovorax sp.]
MKRQPRKTQPPAAAKAAPGKQLPEAHLFEPPESEDEDESDVPDELAEETGLDLHDASDLDADNVTADEESERVLRAPD